MAEIIDENGKRVGEDDWGPALVYGLFLAGFFLALTPVIGLIVAYVQQGRGPSWTQSHYRYQIRSFWIGLLGGVTLMLACAAAGAHWGGMASFEDRGFWMTMSGMVGMMLGALAAGVWFFIRAVRGLILALREEPVPVPDSWLFG